MHNRFLIHFINVFITNRFLGKKWEREQREKLVNIQKNKLAKIQQEIEKAKSSETSTNTNPDNALT